MDALRRAGFARRGRRFARFGCGCAYEVEIFSSDCLGLADDVAEHLFAQARPLDGCRQLVRPAPHHLLLLLSGFVLSDPGALDDKRRRAVQRALAEDSQAWERAAAQAPRWPRPDALVRLRRSFERHAGPRLHRRDRGRGWECWSRSPGSTDPVRVRTRAGWPRRWSNSATGPQSNGCRWLPTGHWSWSGDRSNGWFGCAWGPGGQPDPPQPSGTGGHRWRAPVSCCGRAARLQPSCGPRTWRCSTL